MLFIIIIAVVHLVFASLHTKSSVNTALKVAGAPLIYSVTTGSFSGNFVLQLI